MFEDKIVEYFQEKSPDLVNTSPVFLKKIYDDFISFHIEDVEGMKNLVKGDSLFSDIYGENIKFPYSKTFIDFKLKGAKIGVLALEEENFVRLFFYKEIEGFWLIFPVTLFLKTNEFSDKEINLYREDYISSFDKLNMVEEKSGFREKEISPYVTMFVVEEIYENLFQSENFYEEIIDILSVVNSFLLLLSSKNVTTVKKEDFEKLNKKRRKKGKIEKKEYRVLRFNSGFSEKDKKEKGNFERK